MPPSALRHRTCPNAARCAAATGSTTRAITKRASSVTSGLWRPHPNRSRPVTTSETRSTRPNGSTRPSRPCGRRTDDERAQAFYNLGNAQFKQQKYKEALESYKQSLRLNPSDQEAKYNYAYTKRLIDDDENGGGGGGDDKNQDKDQNKEQQQDGQDQQNGDQQKDDQQKDDKGQGDDKEQQGDPQQNPAQPDKEQEGDPQGEPQPVPAGISPQEQEQMLDAIQAQEDRTQDKLKEKQGVVVRGSKNW